MMSELKTIEKEFERNIRLTRNMNKRVANPSSAQLCEECGQF
jgi:hypothetical protein